MRPSTKYPHPFGGTARRFRNMLGNLPMDISVLAQNDFRENFRRQGYHNKGGVLIPWRKRSVVRKRSDNGRGILIKSGKLMRGIRPAPNHMLAKVINSVPYAKVHNEGFKGTVKVEAHERAIYKRSREGTGIHSIRSRRERMKTVSTRTGSAEVKAHTRKVNMPARPFMKDSPVLDREISKHIDRELDKIWKAA